MNAINSVRAARTPTIICCRLLARGEEISRTLELASSFSGMCRRTCGSYPAAVTTMTCRDKIRQESRNPLAQVINRDTPSSCAYLQRVGLQPAAEALGKALVARNRGHDYGAAAGVDKRQVVAGLFRVRGRSLQGREGGEKGAADARTIGIGIGIGIGITIPDSYLRPGCACHGNDAVLRSAVDWLQAARR